MKTLNWNTEKSLTLKASRGICFEDVVFFIEKGEILDDYIHPNQKAYPGQRILVIGLADYAYLVPYMENQEELFLKTIIPSRKATQRYFGDKHEEETRPRRKGNAG